MALPGYRTPETAVVGTYSKALEGYDRIKSAQAGVEKDFRNLSNSDLRLGTGFWSTSKAVITSIKTGKMKTPEPVEKLLSANSACFSAFTEVNRAYEKLKMAPSDVKAAADYAAASIGYMQKLYDLQAQVQHFEQTNQKGKMLVNSINFALDAVTVPLIAYGVGSAVEAGIKKGFQEVMKAAFKNAAKGMVPSAGYAGLMTMGDYYGMKDLDIAARKFSTDPQGAMKSLLSSLKEMRLKSAELGMKNLTTQIVDTEFDALMMSDLLKEKRVDAAELAGKFALYFAAGLVVSAMLSAGAAPKAARAPKVVKMPSQELAPKIQVKISYVNSSMASSRDRSKAVLNLSEYAKKYGFSDSRSEYKTANKPTRGHEVFYTHELTFKDAEAYEKALPFLKGLHEKGYGVSAPRVVEPVAAKPPVPAEKTYEYVPTYANKIHRDELIALDVASWTKGTAHYSRGGTHLGGGGGLKISSRYYADCEKMLSAKTPAEQLRLGKAYVDRLAADSEYDMIQNVIRYDNGAMKVKLAPELIEYASREVLPLLCYNKMVSADQGYPAWKAGIQYIGAVVDAKGMPTETKLGLLRALTDADGVAGVKLHPEIATHANAAIAKLESQ